MFGDTNNTLNIYVRAGRVDTLIWSLQGNQDDEWQQGTTYLPISLNDFLFEQCYEISSLSTCEQIIGDSIEANKCDYELDCYDGSDEDDNLYVISKKILVYGNHQMDYYLQLRINSTIQKDTLAIVSTYLGVALQQGCTMRFWIYFKTTNNGQLVVNYRHFIGDDITLLSFSTYQSCATNAIQCS
ncbi:unnamed protein product [Rotaria sp. Silwood2]|nr:unnamed protein product [Rotaria sp. Silwood2]CAF4478513.1 unnamed protein product [Rotaria sp. Silwood2]